MDIKVSDVVCVVCNLSFIKNSKVILYIYLDMEQIYTRLKSDLIKQGFKIDDMFLQNLISLLFNVHISPKRKYNAD